MAIVTAEHERVIARPLDVVRAQFADARHHKDTHVHSALTFSDIREDGDVLKFVVTRKVMGMTQRDEIEQAWQPDGKLLAKSVAGTNAGLCIHQSFAADGAGTRVKVRVELPVNGLMRLLTPILRAALQKDTVDALEEDRKDLEEKGYAPGALQSA